MVASFAPSGALWLLGGALVDRYGSATVMFLLTAACLPLQDYTLSQQLVMGEQRAPLSPSLWEGLAVIVAGLVAYAVGALRTSSWSTSSGPR
jgi:nitrate/nitrite transporter NarK